MGTFFNDLGKKLSETGQKALNKTEELGDTLKLKGEISDCEREINITYAAIGKKYYEEHSGDDSEEYADLCAKITDLTARIDDLQNKIKMIKGL